MELTFSNGQFPESKVRLLYVRYYRTYKHYNYNEQNLCNKSHIMQKAFQTISFPTYRIKLTFL
jgi:hypothetical protein